MQNTPLARANFVEACLTSWMLPRARYPARLIVVAPTRQSRSIVSSHRLGVEDGLEFGGRTCLKAAAFGGAVGMGGGFFDLSKARAEMRVFKISRITETRSTCPCCAVSCGVIIH